MRPLLPFLVGLVLAAPALAGDPILSFFPSWNGRSGQDGSEYGSALAGAGDLNGDGFDDVVVGARSFHATLAGEGRVFAYFGAAGGLPMQPGWTFDGGQAQSALGASVAAAGDVNGDGFDDVVVGQPEWDNGESAEGRVLVFLGSAAGLGNAPAWTFEPDMENARAGAAVTGAGDVNGDGFDDVLVALPNASGLVLVFQGSSVGLGASPAATLAAPAAAAGFGRSIAGAGDVNGDGFGDVIVGAPMQTQGQSNEGIAHLYLGAPTGLSVVPAASVQSDRDGAHLGWAVARAGDVDGDGFDDVIVGAPHYLSKFQGEGRVFVFRGSAAGLQQTAAWTADGHALQANFGSAVGAAGDLNRDGFDDVVVGAPGYDDPLFDEGRAFVFLGGPTGPEALPAWPEALPAWSVKKGQSQAQLGTAVDGAGDVNGDGRLDVIAGGRGLADDLDFADVFDGGDFAAVAPYGFGKGFTLVAWPRLYSTLPPRLGQLTLVQLHMAQGSVIAAADPVFLVVGYQPASLAFDGGTLWTEPVTVHLLPKLQGDGSLLFPLRVTNDPGLLGADVYLQAGFVHPFAPGDAHTFLTNGLRWTLGF